MISFNLAPMAGVVNMQPHQVQIYSGEFSLRERGSGQPAKIIVLEGIKARPNLLAASPLPRSFKDRIHKWRLNNYSFVSMLIILTSLVSKNEIQKNFGFKVRLMRMISIETKESPTSLLIWLSVGSPCKRSGFRTLAGQTLVK